METAKAESFPDAVRIVNKGVAQAAILEWPANDQREWPWCHVIVSEEFEDTVTSATNWATVDPQQGITCFYVPLGYNETAQTLQAI